MPPARIAVLAGLLLALGGALAVLYFARDQADAPPPAPAVVRFDPAAAARRAAERIAIEPASRSAPTADRPAAYAEATVALGDPDGFARFLFGLHDGFAEALVVIARIEIGARALAPVPLMVATRSPTSAGTDKKKTAERTAPITSPFRVPFSFAAGSEAKELTAPFALTGDGQVAVALDVAYGRAADADAAATEAAALAQTLGQGLPLFTAASGADAGAFAAQAERFRNRFIRSADERLEGLVALTLDPANPARRIAFKDATGNPAGAVTVALALRGPMIANGRLDYRRAAAIAVGPERRVGPYLARQGALATAIIAGAAPEAEAACAGLARALGADLGLAAADAARIVAAVVRARAPFAKPVPAGACGPSRSPDSAAAGTPTADARIEGQTLLRLSGALRRPLPRKGGEPLVGMFAEATALFDLSGLWLAPGDAGVLAGERVRIRPAADTAEAIDAVRALPVARMGCFGVGRSDAEGHRAALLELRGDKGLWHLELAFDGAGKIAGVAFDAAGQGDFCRLAVRRGAGAGVCAFAAVRYRGIDPKRC